MLPARTFSVSIDHEWRALYERIWRPEFFPNWASGLAQSNLRFAQDAWLADGPEGPIRIRFTPHNAFGVMDHWVETGTGSQVHVPLRIVPNDDGAEVMLTLFRQPDMDDERFAADARWVNRDLKRLQSLVRRQATGPK
ncbi:polyketide cyclase [uncultured Sphingomonas sp.]|uniref:polyketide cyclase n=1 Tax=uncultured Sphingomonas sp. TaxID=158754 RepID=UPI002628D5D7|nr:polyketide cyclase [uncultured Sphingomonas sp.]